MSQSLQQFQTQLSTCMLADKHLLRRKLRDVADLQNLSDENAKLKAQRLLGEVVQKVRASQVKYAARLASLPKPEYPLELPVSSRRDEISEAIKNNQVVIVCGETGSGKTTQLPKICLELGRGVAGLIGHTQPRRIAARSVASRIAQELNSPLGEVVGYKVRFNDKITAGSYVKLMTDGILLAETQGDKFLNAYDTIIIDEAHERSLNIDFLLGYLKQLLPKRPDLKVIVTSATIDAERFSSHFNGAPVIEVSGRTYPVEIRYRPLGKAGFRAKESAETENAQFDLDDDNDSTFENISAGNILGIPRKAKTEARWLEEDDEEEAIEEAIMDAADDLLRQGDGDILVFLPGEREIRDVADHLRKYQGRSAKLKHIEVLPLFARLSIEDQQKIFKPHSARRIVLATNVAETSLTVPGIKYVIDAGLARMNRYSVRAKVEQLQIEKISQAAAKQRAGRCGRVSNGICVRLYSELDFDGRPEFTEPEILRSSLASVILRMAALRLGNIADFPFIEAPSSRLIADGYLLLQELGAVDDKRQITEIGLQLAKLPLDPRVARMILAAKRENCLSEILIIASVLSMQDPRERPMDKREAADNAHSKFVAEGSDFMSYLKIWDFYDNALKTKKSNKDLLNICHANFLSFLRLKEWRELHGQLLEIVFDMGDVGVRFIAPKTLEKGAMNHAPTEKEATFEQIHKALLAGLLGNIGFKDGDNDSYAGARGIRFFVAPGSGLKKTRPKWVVAAELVDTSKLYARCVAKIEPDWIEPLARGLTESQYSDPRWDRKMGMVNAWERVSLYGLTIIPKRRVHYGPINPQESREIFIREALGNGEFDTRAAFFVANERLIAEVEELEHKARRQDVLVDEHQLFAFYDSKIPANIVNAASFEAWREGAEKLNPKLLYLTRDDLMRHGADAITAVQFPETLVLSPPAFEVEGQGGGGASQSRTAANHHHPSFHPHHPSFHPHHPSFHPHPNLPPKMGKESVILNLKYRFEPSHILDGVTATVPLALLNQLDPTPTEWLVPGMLREKLTYLIKALPKTFRRVCVPVPEFVTGFLEHSTTPLPNPSDEATKQMTKPASGQVTANPTRGERLKVGGMQALTLRASAELKTPYPLMGEGWGEGGAYNKPLLETLAAYIQQKTTLKISKDDWVLSEIPVHHLMNFSIVDDAGRELAMGRDWRALQKQLGQAAQLTFRNTSPDIEKTNLKQWDFGDLPQTLSFERDGLKVTGYPALEDNIDAVSVKLFDTAREAAMNHRQGVCRLMRFELKEQIKQLEKSLPNFNQYALSLRTIISPDDLREDMLTAIADRAFINDDDLPRTNADFMKLKQRARTRLPAVSEAIGRQAQAIASEYQLLMAQQAKMPATVNRLKKDVEQQVQLLVYKNCFTHTPWEYLQNIPRYLKALRLRIEKHPAAPDRDGKNAASVGAIWQKWQDKVNQMHAAGSLIPPALQDYRWLIEELRVSLFAQELKTPFPVSIKRLEKTWAEINH